MTSCAGQSDCSGNGVCIEIDLCDCKKGYTGSDCSKFSCEAKEFCSRTTDSAEFLLDLYHFFL